MEDFLNNGYVTTASDFRAIARNAKEDADLKKHLAYLNREKEYQRKLLELDIKVTRNKFRHSRDRIQRSKSSIPAKNTASNRLLTRCKSCSFSPIDENEGHRSTSVNSSQRSKKIIFEEEDMPYKSNHETVYRKSSIVRLRSVSSTNCAKNSLVQKSIPQNSRLLENKRPSMQEESLFMISNHSPRLTQKVLSSTGGFHQPGKQFKKESAVKVRSLPIIGTGCVPTNDVTAQSKSKDKNSDAEFSKKFKEIFDSKSRQHAKSNLILSRFSSENAKEIQTVTHKNPGRSRSSSMPNHENPSKSVEPEGNSLADVDKISNYIATRMPLIAESAKKINESHKIGRSPDRNVGRDCDIVAETGESSRDCANVDNEESNRVHSLVPVNAWAECGTASEAQPQIEAVPGKEAVKLVPPQQSLFGRARSNTACCISDTMWASIEKAFEDDDSNNGLIDILLGKKKQTGGLSKAEMEDIKHCRYLRLPKYVEDANQSTECCCIFHKSGCDIKSFYNVVHKS